MLKVGLDTFTIRELELSPLEQLDFAKSHGFEGVQFDDIYQISPTLQGEQLREVRDYADRLGLYSHVSITYCNPHVHKELPDIVHERVCHEISVAAEAGWHELRSTLGGVDERYNHPVHWFRQLDDSEKFLRDLRPVLRDHASRINLETHGDSTTQELIRLIERVGPDVLGINLDTANVLVHAEDPVSAARRAAPYTHLTHAKDGILFFSENGLMRQGRPPGQGVVDWEQVLPALTQFSPDLPLSIEDHKWLFEIQIADRRWGDLHPDASAYEIGTLVKLAWGIQQRITAGDLPPVDEYEGVPYLEQMEDRIACGRDYLYAVLRKLGLR
jgi:sugar phosphate isomerase/epimerase